MRREFHNKLVDINNPTKSFLNIERLCLDNFRPGEVLTVDKLIAHDLSPSIIVMGNSLLRSDQLQLRGRDYLPLDQIETPGKSAMLDFLALEGSDVSLSPKVLQLIVQRALSRDYKRQDNVYVTTVSQVQQAGWIILYAPVKTNGLHIRLVCRDQINLRLDQQEGFPSIPTEFLDSLTSILEKVPKNSREVV